MIGDRVPVVIMHTSDRYSPNFEGVEAAAVDSVDSVD